MHKKLPNPASIAKTSQQNFIATFANLYEHSAWVVEGGYSKIKQRNDISLEEFHNVLANVVKNASSDLQNSLINAHPMLVTKKSSDEILTDFSNNEQKSAGLDALTQTESDEFNTLNQEYMEKFGFPFIMAIKNKSKQKILQQLYMRKNNSSTVERNNALEEINNIARLRIAQMYNNN